MSAMMRPFLLLQRLMDSLHHALDWLAPLLLRVYLVPVFYVAGSNKWSDFDSIVSWFGNPEWGLGLPMPELMAFLATGAELAGALLLALGLAVRWITIPLMITMLTAMLTVHWHNGWQAVADPMSPFPGPAIGEAMERLERGRTILQEHGHYGWLTEHGNFVISNNGIEWAATYFVMLLALFALGGGRFVSLDYWLRRRFIRAGD